MNEIQVNSHPLSSYTIGLHNDFHNRSLTLMQAVGAEVLHIEALLPRYSELVAMENSIVKRATTYVSTAQLLVADRKRDTALRILQGIIDYQSRSDIAAKAKAAQALQAKCAAYKNTARSDYRSETREVYGLISVLSTEESLAELATLNLTEELAELVRLNDAFNAFIRDKQQEAAKRMPQINISTEELRHELDTQYATIIQTVNAYAIVQPTEEIRNFIRNLNAAILLTKQSAATLGKSTKEEEESVDTETAETAPEQDA